MTKSHSFGKKHSKMVTFKNGQTDVVQFRNWECRFDRGTWKTISVLFQQKNDRYCNMSRNCVSLARKKQSNLYENHKMQSLYPHASGIVAPNPQQPKKEAIKEKCYRRMKSCKLKSPRFLGRLILAFCSAFYSRKKKWGDKFGWLAVVV